MTNIRSFLLAGVAVAGTFGAAAPANAGPGDLFAGGASLPANYIRAAGDCWGVQVPLNFRSGALVTLNEYSSSLGSCVGAAGQISTDSLYYTSTGSGRGISGFLSNTGEGPGTSPTVNDIDWLGSSVGREIYATKVTFTLSEAGLDDAVIGNAAGTTGIYNLGGLNTQSGLQFRLVAPGVIPNPAAVPVEYRNPRESYGNPIQIPILIAPVTIAYDPVYKKVANAAGVVTEFRFTVPNPRTTGGLRLTRTLLCQIFNGEITTFGDPRLDGVVDKAVNDPDQAAFDALPLIIVGRSDGSGTTSIVTRHLGAICPALVPTSAYTNANAGANTLPASLRNTFPGTPVAGGGGIYVKANPNFPPAPNEAPGKFTIADGNDGVAKYIDFTQVPAAGQTILQGRIGYVGADFVAPFVSNTGQNSFNLFTANVQNRDGSFVAPTPQNANNAFRGLRAPDSNSVGLYTPSQPGDRANPAAGDAQWVQRAAFDSPLADPARDGTTSEYPIVGTTNALIYQCYANTDEAFSLNSFLEFYFSSPIVSDDPQGILFEAGFAPMPKAFRQAILDTFVFDSFGLGLAPAPVEFGGPCAGKVGAGAPAAGL